jgi:N-acetylglutamate synthase/N-acetylornithine aminotransferase
MTSSLRSSGEKMLESLVLASESLLTGTKAKVRISRKSSLPQKNLWVGEKKEIVGDEVKIAVDLAMGTSEATASGHDLTLE